MSIAIQARIHENPAQVSQPFGIVGYYAIGGVYASSTEARTQVKVYNSLVFKNLLIRVILNTFDEDSIATSRDNGADGNQSVAIGAGLTGEFEDISNSDSLTSGDYFNFAIDATTSTEGTIIPSICSCLVEHSTTPISFLMPAREHGYSAGPAGGEDFNPIAGEPIISGSATENLTQCTIRFPATLDKFRIYVYANNTTNTCTFKSRVNGADGNLLITVGAGLTGEFEDTSNSDSLSSGDEINYSINTPTSGPPRAIDLSCLQTRLQPSDSEKFLRIAAHPVLSAVMNFGTTYYRGYGGSMFYANTTESDIQLKIRGEEDYKAQNLFVNIRYNAVDDDTIFRTRVNGANGALSVTVGAGLTGFFEDLVSEETYSADDEVNFQIVVGGTEGDIRADVLAVTLYYEEPAVVGSRGGRSSAFQVLKALVG